jgi:hypothetical protein
MSPGAKPPEGSPSYYFGAYVEQRRKQENDADELPFSSKCPSRYDQGAPDLVAEFLDQHYTGEAVNSVRGYVDRTIELSHMKAERTPSEVTNIYLQEATRTYIIGFPLACVALSRSALEQSLKESLG